MNLILLRHGESEWNLKNQFTGWKDVCLTENGKKEALFAGQEITKLNLTINKVFCSKLIRAKETCNIVCNEINYSIEKVVFDWRLNERHYGALQGLNKSETAKKYGEDQVKIWRRSYNIPPPLLKEDDQRHKEIFNQFNDISEYLPRGESLENVIDRIKPFWKNFNTKSKYNKNYLIVGHSNSLRAIVKILENLSSQEIIDIEIPTGVPLLYKFDSNLVLKSKTFLIDKEELIKKQDLIKNQGKVNQ
tara:strand:- start:1286 stop:2026 length:741 start_codon:yes stop_codon:yes gene_type:complete